MHIFETCCCGASLTVGGFSSDKKETAEQAAEFRKAHMKCRERRKSADEGEEHAGSG